MCFVDYPGFNLRLARALHTRGLTRKVGARIRALYYISPQIWAWKAGRRFEMAEHLDAMAVIFPFEVKSYADTVLPVEFVGHPFAAGDYQSPVSYDPAGPCCCCPAAAGRPWRGSSRRCSPATRSSSCTIPTAPRRCCFPSEEIKGVVEEFPARPARPKAYISQYPNGHFVPVAKLRIADLENRRDAAMKQQLEEMRKEMETARHKDVETEAEIGYWNSVNKNDPEVLELYLQKYPQGIYSLLAHKLIDQVKQERETQRAIKEEERRRRDQAAKENELQKLEQERTAREAKDAEAKKHAEEARNANDLRKLQDDQRARDLELKPGYLATIWPTVASRFLPCGPVATGITQGST